MIDSKELRIGNRYNRKHGKGWTETVIDEGILGKLFGQSLEYALNDFEPIRISPGLLEEVGFVDPAGNGWGLRLSLGNGYELCWYKQDDSLRYQTEGSGVTMDFNLRHLHQLQNFVFVITGKELIEGVVNKQEIPKGVEDLQTQVREHIKAHDFFDWHKNLSEDEMLYLEDLLLTFCPIFPQGSIGYAKQSNELMNQIEKLKAFKDFVHRRLDEAGIEKEPNGEHSKHGCRIGDRLDIVLGQSQQSKGQEADNYQQLCTELRDALRLANKELEDQEASLSGPEWDKIRTAISKADKLLKP